MQTDTYILRGDPAGETFEPRFTFHGFRYVERAPARRSSSIRSHNRLTS
ncbi:MAG TPA: family 78 glycoside hydrolase catalytic domain [Caulobacter sp.]|nr:family 78 glycoside hydrolase catalytic domain [Caulobacter sp.]